MSCVPFLGPCSEERAPESEPSSNKVKQAGSLGRRTWSCGAQCHPVSLQVACEPGQLRFLRYPFAPARCTVARPADLLGYWPGTNPPSLVLRSREIVFWPAARKIELENWCRQHGISPIAPEDVWSLLLEPFLDTQHSPQWQAACLDRLLRCGLDEQEVVRLRRRVERRMLCYNALLWEWVSLGHYDLLEAHRPFNTAAGFEKLYWESMEIAWRGFNR